MTGTTADLAALLDRAADEVNAVRQRNWPPQVPRTVDYPAGTPTVVEHLRYWARHRPDTVAISFYGSDLTYAEYDELSDRFAGYLLAEGIRSGDSVGVYLGNCPQFAIAMLGILKVGAVHVPINPLLKGHELRHELDDAQVGLLLVQIELLDLVDTVRAETAVHTVLVTALGDLVTDPADVPVPFPVGPDPRSDWYRVTAADRAPVRPSDPDAVAALNYTGGHHRTPEGMSAHPAAHGVHRGHCDPRRGPRGGPAGCCGPELPTRILDRRRGLRHSQAAPQWSDRGAHGPMGCGLRCHSDGPVRGD